MTMLCVERDRDEAAARSYKSLATAINDVISGESNMTIAAVGNVRPQVPAGKLKVLAVLEQAAGLQPED
jgi:tripartite-type tricarboxylate transporter receptor subunit TctC